jgi:hypothetical protein
MLLFFCLAVLSEFLIKESTSDRIVFHQFQLQFLNHIQGAKEKFRKRIEGL